MEEIKRGKNMFYIGDENEPMARIIFILTENNEYLIESTHVSEALKGRGIAAKLVNSVVDLARQENKKIIPVCSYALKMLTSSDEYKDVLAK